MKIIYMEISKCLDCPWLDSDGEEAWCLHEDIDSTDNLIIEDFMTIPKWCPLDDNVET